MTPPSDDPETRTNQIRPSDRSVMLGLMIGVQIVYLLTTARHFVGGDQGGFLVAAYEGGYAHAPGYPLYSLYLWATSWISSSIATSTSIATSVIGAAAIGVLYRAMRAWNANIWASVTTSLLYAFMPLLWLMHTHAEVFALNNLIAAALLLLCAPAQPLSPTRRLVVMGAIVGVVAAHNYTPVFLAPLGIYAAYRACREIRDDARTYRHSSKKRIVSGLGLSVAACLAVWIPAQLYLVYVATFRPDSWHWGDPTTLEGWWQLFMRSDYGTFSIGAGEREASSLDQWLFFGRTILIDWLMFPAVLAVLGLIRSFVLSPRKAFWWTLFISWCLCGPIMLSLIHWAPEGWMYALVKKFHILPLVVMAPFVASGIDFLSRYVSSSLMRIALTIVSVSLMLDMGSSYIVLHHSDAPELYGHDPAGFSPARRRVRGKGRFELLWHRLHATCAWPTPRRRIHRQRTLSRCMAHRVERKRTRILPLGLFPKPKRTTALTTS